MLLATIKSLINLATKSVAGKFFWNYQLYRKYACDQNNQGGLKLVSTGRFAIVIQGPYIYDDDFTIETIKIYRQNFPESIIILSTWSVSVDIIEALKKHDVYVIQNQKPTNPGISNINLQIITSSVGILAARDLRAQYVLKTRTDQRIYHPSLETFLFNILKTFPLAEDAPIQINRLIVISLGTLKYRLYGVSDMFLYGHIDDMVRYWNIPLDVRKDSLDKRCNEGVNTWRTFSTWRVCEVYLCTEFLKSIGRDITFTLADSFRVFRDHFVVIDQAAIKLYWHKYTLNAERYAGLGFFDAELSFNDWLILYNSIGNMIIDETILDQPISKTE